MFEENRNKWKRKLLNIDSWNCILVIEAISSGDTISSFLSKPDAVIHTVTSKFKFKAIHAGIPNARLS